MPSSCTSSAFYSKLNLDEILASNLSKFQEPNIGIFISINIHPPFHNICCFGFSRYNPFYETEEILIVKRMYIEKPKRQVL
jgi:hypothetical protein